MKTYKFKYIHFLVYFIIMVFLFGCAPVQTQEQYNSFISANDNLGKELELLRNELSRLKLEESGLMDTLDGQRLQASDLVQQLQQLHLQEENLKAALNTYEDNIHILQPLLNNINSECKQKILDNHNKIIDSIGNLLLDFVPSPFRAVKLFFEIPALIQRISSVIKLIQKANHSIELVKSLANAQYATC